jgi:hypothetical protein
LPRTRCLTLIHKSMMRARVRLPRMNSPNLILRITGRINYSTPAGSRWKLADAVLVEFS